MFRTGHPMDQPLRLRPELLLRALRRRVCTNPARGHPRAHGPHPQRWSDIFFLGMDYPEGARVLNVSIDLAVREVGGAGGAPGPRWRPSCA